MLRFIISPISKALRYGPCVTVESHSATYIGLSSALKNFSCRMCFFILKLDD